MMCRGGWPIEYTPEEASDLINSVLSYANREGFIVPILEVGKLVLEAIKKHKNSFDPSQDACMFTSSYGVVKIKA